MKKFIIPLIILLFGVVDGLQAQLYINNTTLYIDSLHYVTVQGDVQSNVNITGKGKLLLNGNYAQALDIRGNKLYSMDIDNPAGVNLASSLAADGNVAFIRGILNLQHYVLDLGSGNGSLSGESDSSHLTAVTGTVSKTAVFNAPDLFNPGDLGLVVTSTANMGTLTITRGHQQQTSSNSGLSIDRYFDITAPAVNSNLNATFGFSYFNAELAGRAKNELTLWTSSDSGRTWSNLGVDAADTTKDVVIKGGIPHFSRFTLASTVHNALPLTLLEFMGHRTGGIDRLQWLTADEQNTHLFEVEYSTDGRGFDGVGSIYAIGSGSHRYSFDHAAGGPAFYRLKMIDIDGHFTYSIVIEMDDVQNLFQSRVQPNPLYSSTQLVTGDSRLLGTKAQLLDMSGRLIRTFVIVSTQQTIDLSGYGEGTYLIKLANGELLRLLKK